MEEASARSRRRHDQAFKERVLALCAQPGASVASVALEHGLNANLVHRWRRLERSAHTAVRGERREMAQFVPVALPVPHPAAAPMAAAPAPAAEVRIELRRGATAITVHWPAAAAPDCAAWMRELLR